MEVYIEYAFLENFLFDGVLLWLSLRASLTPVYPWRLLLGSTIGAVFALTFPFLKLPFFVLQTLKFSVGFLLCLLAFPQIKSKNEWGRYALTCTFFFVFSFGFGGVLLAVYGVSSSPSTFLVMIGFAVLTAFSSYLVRKLYKKRTVHRFLYDCHLYYADKEACVTAFLDSGNLARKNGLPVCFLSPDVFYDLYWADLEERQGQVCDEIEISTLSGVEKMPMIKGKIVLGKAEKGNTQEAYFACSKHMIAREYKMLLSPYLWESSAERREK